MKYDVKPCRILYKREIAQGIFDFLLDAEDFAKMAKPGQFAHILVPGKTLRRPISICDIDAESGTLRIVFQIRGEGTRNPFPDENWRQHGCAGSAGQWV